MSTDLVLHSTEEAFTLAERICRSVLVPTAYRGKPMDAAIAMLYGAECGLPPMTSMQRIAVINGKPTLDAQGMTSLIRMAGHSVDGSVTLTGAKITGKRGDNGDTMTVEWGPDDAKRARLTGDTYNKFPMDMYWARAVSQLGRRLFSDVLLGISYGPDEIQAVVDSDEPEDAPKVTTRREPPARTAAAETWAAANPAIGTIIAAEIVEAAPPDKAPSWCASLHIRAKELKLSDDQLGAVVAYVTTHRTRSTKDLKIREASSVNECLTGCAGGDYVFQGDGTDTTMVVA